MYVAHYHYQSESRLISVLAYFGIFVIKNIPNLKNIVFQNGEVLISSAIPDQIEIIRNRLIERNFIRTEFLSRSDLTKAKKSFKHVLLWQLMHNDYFGIISSKEIIEQMVDADSDMYNYLGEGMYAFINNFSESAKSLEIIGYSRLIRDILPLDQRLELLDFVESCVDVPYQYFLRNPDKFKGGYESLMDSFYRFKEDILAIPDYHNTYGDLFT